MSAIQFVQTNDSLRVTFNACTRQPLSWKEEIYAAARTVASKAKKPLWLCSSGGIDSEVMCQSFFDQGINFSVLTLAHTEGTNEHDIRYARQWCKAHGVYQEIVQINMQNFFDHEIENYVKEGYIADHPFRYLQIKLMEAVERLDGFAVLAGGEQYFMVEPRKATLARNDVFLTFDADKAAPLQWIERNAKSHEPYFMYATPEVCLSYLRIPLVDFVLDHPDILRHPVSPFTLKRLVFQSVWLENRSRPKYHGFEKITARTLAVKKKLHERFSKQLPTYHMPVGEFEAWLSANLPIKSNALSNQQ